DTGPFVILSTARYCVFEEVWFENTPPNQTRHFIILNNGGNLGTRIGNCNFERGSSATDPRLIVIGGNSGIDLATLIVNPVCRMADVTLTGTDWISIGANCRGTTIIGGHAWKVGTTA